MSDFSNRNAAITPTDAAYAGDVAPSEAWQRLARDPDAQLVDVRTKAEWTFIGVPDLTPLNRKTLFCEWQYFPPQTNPEFVQQMTRLLSEAGHKKGAPLFFLCRSGTRSRNAAIALTAAGFGPCFNVADGFEGSPDANGHRGTRNGWKAAGLAWTQT